jgi:hypothetical protein
VHLASDQHRGLAVNEELMIARFERVRLAVRHYARDCLSGQIEDEAGGDKSGQNGEQKSFHWNFGVDEKNEFFPTRLQCCKFSRLGSGMGISSKITMEATMDSSHLNYPHIDVETLFNELVREYPSAEILSENKYLPKPLNFLNADYLFHSEKVVAEFKIITEDNTDSANNIAKRLEIINQFFKDGKIASTTIDESNWSSLPMELQNSISDISTNAIFNRVKKANKQIRETKLNLGLADYAGLLIIVNDGMVSISPAAFQWAVFRLLMRHFSEIHHFIFFTANIRTKFKSVPQPSFIWSSCSMQKEKIVDEAFARLLHTKFTGIVSRKTGIVSNVREMTDEEDFWKAQNIK